VDVLALDGGETKYRIRHRREDSKINPAL